MAQLLAGIFKLKMEIRKGMLFDTREEHEQECHMILFAVRTPHFNFMCPVIGQPLDDDEHLDELLRTSPA
jgi:hypothetical protein